MSPIGSTKVPFVSISSNGGSWSIGQRTRQIGVQIGGETTVSNSSSCLRILESILDLGQQLPLHRACAVFPDI